MIMTVAEAYRATAQRLNERGWTQHNWRSETGEECLVQALTTTLACPHIRAIPRVYLEPLAQAIGAKDIPLMEDDKLRDTLTRWNDTPGRTMDEVIKLLTNAAAEPKSRWFRSANLGLKILGRTPRVTVPDTIPADIVAHEEDRELMLV